MSNDQVRMRCLELAMTMQHLHGAEDVTAEARKLEAYVLGKGDTPQPTETYGRHPVPFEAAEVGYMTGGVRPDEPVGRLKGQTGSLAEAHRA